MSLDGQDAEYIGKLRRSKRDPALVAAFILLLLAMRRLKPTTSLEAIAAELAPTTTLLAARIAVYVARQMQATPESTRAVAGPLLGAVATHTADALKLALDERNQRLGLIAQAETQNATVAVSKRAALAGRRTITRRTASANPCKKCAELAGTYPYPYMADIFFSHPRCSCLFRVEYDTPAS